MITLFGVGLALSAVNVLLWLYTAPYAVRRMKCRPDMPERQYDATAPSLAAQDAAERRPGGLHTVCEDALNLANYALGGQRITRRQAERRWKWPARRWNVAYGAAKSAGIFGNDDELLIDDYEAARELIETWRADAWIRERNPNYVSAR